MIEITTPNEVLDLLRLDEAKFGSSSLPMRLALRTADYFTGKDFLHSNVFDTFSPEDVRTAVRNSALMRFRDMKIFYGLDFGHPIFGIPKKLQRFGREDQYEIFCVLLEVVERMRAIVAEILEQNGNIVYRGIVRRPPLTDNGDRSYLWHQSRRNPGVTMRRKSEIFKSSSCDEFAVGGHPNLTNERYLHINNPNGDTGAVVFAENCIGIPTLRDACDSFSLEDKIKIIIDVMRGCNFLHEHGQVHRDVKPANILVFQNNDSPAYGKLCDHELVTATDAPARDAIAGTLPYADFEWHDYGLFWKDYRIHPGIDVFAFGITLLEQFYGKKFVKLLKSFLERRHSLETGKLNVLDQIDHLIKTFVSDSGSGIHLPEGIRDLIFRMFVFDPKDRPPLSKCIEVLEKELALM
jgi:serine/threonine protein kinase